AKPGMRDRAPALCGRLRLGGVLAQRKQSLSIWVCYCLTKPPHCCPVRIWVGEFVAVLLVRFQEFHPFRQVIAEVVACSSHQRGSTAAHDLDSLRIRFRHNTGSRIAREYIPSEFE